MIVDQALMGAMFVIGFACGIAASLVATGYAFKRLSTTEFVLKWLRGDFK